MISDQIFIGETVLSRTLVTYILSFTWSYAIPSGSLPTLIGGCASTPIINNGNKVVNIPATIKITRKIELAFVTLAFTLVTIIK